MICFPANGDIDDKFYAWSYWSEKEKKCILSPISCLLLFTIYLDTAETSWSISKKLLSRTYSQDIMIKVCITSFQILEHFDPSKPIFLKSGWSSEDMPWFLIQPAENEELIRAACHLMKPDERLFGFSNSGVYLKHMVWFAYVHWKSNVFQLFHKERWLWLLDYCLKS